MVPQSAGLKPIGWQPTTAVVLSVCGEMSWILLYWWTVFSADFVDHCQCMLFVWLQWHVLRAMTTLHCCLPAFRQAKEAWRGSSAMSAGNQHKSTSVRATAKPAADSRVGSRTSVIGTASAATFHDTAASSSSSSARTHTATASSSSSAGDATAQSVAAVASFAPGPLLLFPDTSALLSMLGCNASTPTKLTLNMLQVHGGYSSTHHCQCRC